MKCPKCAYENPGRVKVCTECGTELRLKLVCPQCGQKNHQRSKFCSECGHSLVKGAPETPQPSPEPTSFANGRYQVKRFLGEGGKKRVYLVHDKVLGRDVVFARIKTEKLDEGTRLRFSREAQVLGQLGDHPNIMTVHDMGDESGQPYIVLTLMPGGDVESLLEKAPERRLSIEQAVSIGKAVCRGLEYAHGKGIIHRDIKPGNVWLSNDGTPKVGDFGLALATDLSRLTDEGVMVGTYYYMPPEQAMGGEITAQADLYSLGAMLYEMTSGRPPFTGDDMVAILGQHINTPPVSPGWYRPDLPPALSALIMSLLEKDPNKRPASATEVLETLEAIESGKADRLPTPQSKGLADSPLYRRIFVGREAELRQLQSCFDAATSGQGSLMMVVGEPGIGKTTLCEQLATYVGLRGGRVLVGHCYEEGSLSLPYLAFVEALRTYAQTRDVNRLRKELGPGAPDVGRIVSEVRERLRIQPRPKGDPEEERYRLLQAVSDFLGSVAAAQPLLVVLEDLQSADRGTLEMLEHVAHNLGDKRLLLVGTYRDIEVDRTHPLSTALAELRRLRVFGRVLLRGLNADEVRRMLSGIAGQDVPWRLAEAVHRQTEGNPLFVQEVVRYLAEEGIIEREQGKWQARSDTPLEMRIPDGLRDVIGKRLSGLSESCNKVISVAAVIGRDFQVRVLQKVAGIDDDELFGALEEARKAAVIEERTGTGGKINYRFAHAFFRQTLYEETIAPRRIRLHQQVARALEDIYKDRLEQHAAELAEHFSYSSDRADLEKAVSYGEMAARSASDVYSHGEAVRLLEQALKVQDVVDPEDKTRRCDLLLALGWARFYNHEYRHILDDEAPVALALAEKMGDTGHASKACLLASFTLEGIGSGVAFGTDEAAKWTEALDRYAPPDTIERVWADRALASKKESGDIAGAWPLFRQSMLLARKLGDASAFVNCGGDYLGYCPPTAEHVEEARPIANEMRQVWDRADPFSMSYGMETAGSFFLMLGERTEGEAIHREAMGSARLARAPVRPYFFPYLRACYHIMDGQLEEAAKCHEDVLRFGAETDSPQYATLYAVFSGPRLFGYLGWGRDQRRRLEESVQAAHLFLQALSAYHLICMGESEEAVAVLDEIADHYAAEPEKPTTAFGGRVLQLELAVLANHRRATEILFNLLVGGVYKTTGLLHPTCVARHLGGAAALLGRHQEARKHYKEAIKVCIKMRIRPELALTRLQLAELLLEHYPKEMAAALEHLDFAISEFSDMKMRPWLERALRHKEILKA
jgi:tetratricopeptide (TPR) repeat protein/tRNA A-37 threonylcarbamoyl transferase component Bud32